MALEGGGKRMGSNFSMWLARVGKKWVVGAIETHFITWEMGRQRNVKILPAQKKMFHFSKHAYCSIFTLPLYKLSHKSMVAKCLSIVSIA